MPKRYEPSLEWRAVVSKLSLVAFGIALIASVSRDGWAMVVLGATCAMSFGLGRWLQLRASQTARRLIGRIAVPVAVVALVLLNVTGLVGTLTGAQSAVAGSSLIGLPFYLLSAAAFIVEMCSLRSHLPKFLDYLVYMVLPFKLLAGPLESPRLLLQIKACRFDIRWSRLRVAWSWVVLGAFMKYVVANRLDPARHLIHTDPMTSFLVAAIFELKFYFDFAGYSFMAYGAALVIGLHLNRNFDHPFLARNVVLFWRSWHMSLGRYLAKYVLEPNLSIWRGREQKIIFASGIFLVSAMWHGGTLNYLLWGFFHGACYYIYGQSVRHHHVPVWLGRLAMLLFFVFGRMLAIDADGARLLQRLGNYFSPRAYSFDMGRASAGMPFLSNAEVSALIVAALFLLAEIASKQRYPHRNGYHLMRRPVGAFALLMLFILFGVDDGSLLYARI